MDRRRFVAALGAAATAPGMALACSADSRTRAEALPGLDSRLSSALFEAYRGEVFRCSATSLEAGAVRLNEIRRQPGGGLVDQFTLSFAPVSGEMPSTDDLFLLEHANGGRIALALQPVSDKGTVRSLTASFSLLLRSPAC